MCDGLPKDIGSVIGNAWQACGSGLCSDIYYCSIWFVNSTAHFFGYRPYDVSIDCLNVIAATRIRPSSSSMHALLWAWATISSGAATRERLATNLNQQKFKESMSLSQRQSLLSSIHSFHET